MGITDRDRNRVKALILRIRPAHSLACRVDALSDDDREIYRRWVARHEQWIERCKARDMDDMEPDARPYASMLQGHGPPTLRRDIDAALFDPKPMIPSTAGELEAARIYEDYRK